MIKKYTKEILDLMSAKEIRTIDITSPEDEELIQAALLSKSVISQPSVRFNHNAVPDIKSPEQEKEWQGKIDSFNLDHSPIEAKIAVAEKELETVKSEIVEVVSVVVPSIDPIGLGTVTSTDPTPFCDKCDSKGVRHKKVCPLYVPTTK